MNNIKNKTALITGGASGLGFDYAQKLLQNGAKAVAILDLASSPGQTTAANLEKEFGKGKAIFCPCDVSNVQQLTEAFKKVWNALNGLDIVINNAGICNDTKWQQTVNINVTGLIQGSLLAMELMGKHKGGKGGTIVNISSIVGFQLFPIIPVYCSSKWDVMAFSRCLQTHYDNTGVRVLVMCPGVTTTNLLTELENTVFNFVKPEDVQQTLRSLPTQP
ncbi:15-hydroxyprostaglandin dehydrogenase [NAD(+)]-like [Ceratina calcarata]|nr:15-hydroxyprostaglandin dehydrogenase [NAD(+)]-like [Ceratina calcarata]